MVLKAKVDCSVYRLLDVAHESLPGGAGCGRQLVFWHASLLQTLSELGLSAAFLAVPLLALPQTPIERSVGFAVRCSDEICYPDINADHRCMRRGLTIY